MFPGVWPIGENNTAIAVKLKAEVRRRANEFQFFGLVYCGSAERFKRSSAKGVCAFIKKISPGGVENEKRQNKQAKNLNFHWLAGLDSQDI